MIKVKLPRSRKDDFRKAEALWLAGEPLEVCGGDVLPNGTKITKADVRGETVSFEPDNSGFGYYLQTEADKAEGGVVTKEAFEAAMAKAGAFIIREERDTEAWYDNYFRSSADADADENLAGFISYKTGADPIYTIVEG